MPKRIIQDIKVYSRITMCSIDVALKVLEYAKKHEPEAVVDVIIYHIIKETATEEI